MKDLSSSDVFPLFYVRGRIRDLENVPADSGNLIVGRSQELRDYADMLGQKRSILWSDNKLKPEGREEQYPIIEKQWEFDINPNSKKKQVFLDSNEIGVSYEVGQNDLEIKYFDGFSLYRQPVYTLEELYSIANQGLLKKIFRGSSISSDSQKLGLLKDFMGHIYSINSSLIPINVMESEELSVLEEFYSNNPDKFAQVRFAD